MKVELISRTNCCINEDMTPEQLIVHIARVSNPDNQMNHETAPKLIAYLIKNKHWSPFEHVSITIKITTSRAIAAQILRHRSFTFQEFSQRYSEATEFEDIDFRKQSEKNRQSSIEKGDLDIFTIGAVEKYLQAGKSIYQALLAKGIAKECARMVLPLATQTTLYMTGTVRSWIHYLEIRCDEHTQLEHREIAEEIKDIFKVEFPEISKALLWD